MAVSIRSYQAHSTQNHSTEIIYIIHSIQITEECNLLKKYRL